VSILVLSALGATVRLVDVLITGGPQTNSASDLLEAGSIVWVANVLAFALLYWSSTVAARQFALTTHATTPISLSRSR
jgi:hypothetical protein